MAAVDICNRALIKIGHSKLLTALTDTTREGILLNAIYSDSRDYLLQAFTWNFATKRVALSATTDPAFGYANAFQLPADCLRAIIDDEETNAVFRVENGVLLSDASAINLIYIAQITDTASFSPMFKEALATYLAAEIAEAMTANTNQAGRLKKEFEDVFSKAKKADSQEGTPFNWRPTFKRRT